jgi:cell division control protein 6
MSFNSESAIILDADVLTEEYKPADISPRKPHFEELKRCVAPAMKAQKPLTTWLHGRPGTGKTTVASHILSELNKKTNVPSIYINCWKHNTFYSVLEHIVNEMRRGFGDARDTAVKLKQFEQLVKDRPCIIVLDEIDLVNRNERNDMIYNLFSIGKVGLICISESRYPILSLDSRIKSRLSPQIVSFEMYSVDELLEILRDRANKALYSNSWTVKALRQIAVKANGDARIAIQTLKNAAYYADSKGAKMIHGTHVEKGFTDTEGLRKSYDLKRLTEHHMVLYNIIMEQPGITSPELFDTYINECERRNWKPVASRTFSLYMKKMTELRLIKVERARVKGRVHSFRIWKYSMAQL